MIPPTILITYIKGPRFRHRDITINRLVSPLSPPSQRAFGLRWLLAENSSVKLPVDNLTIAEIREFLTSVTALKFRDTQKLINAFLKDWLGEFKSQADSGNELSPEITNAIQSFANDLLIHKFSPVGNQLVRHIRDKVFILLQRPPNNTVSCQPLGAPICEMIHLLAADVDFYTMLTLDTFTGPRIVHCEASLATFLILSPGVFESRYDRIIEQLRVCA